MSHAARWAVMAGAFVALLPLGLVPAEADAPRQLIAYVFERPQGKDGLQGASVALAAAGFQVRTLPLRRPPDQLGAHLIVFGSWMGENVDYRPYMARYGAKLTRFVERGGVVFHFTLADQREVEPAFLPVGLRAWRTDKDFKTLVVRDPAHPLTADLPLHGNPPRFRNPGTSSFSWESFAWHEGFRALLTADADGKWPGLLEGAHGKGRIVLTSLWLDKIRKGDGTPYAKDGWRSASAALFRNLERYTRLVVEGKAPAVLVDRSPVGAPDVGTEPPEPAQWKLAPSDAVIYDRSQLSTNSASVPYIVFGRDVKDDGQFAPPRFDTRTLVNALALRVCRSESGVEKIKLRLPRALTKAPSRLDGTVDTGTIEVRGTLRCTTTKDGMQALYGSYTFATRKGRVDGGASIVSDGKARVRGVFDPVRGVVRESRIAYSWTQAAAKAKKGALRTRKGGYVQFRLRAVHETRYPGFRVHVDTAIDKAVAYLEKNQKKDGSYPGLERSYHTGITALTVMALVACGVPVTSPRVEGALAWLCEQEAGGGYGGLYEAALCLMAFEAAYANSSFKSLPPKRRAWCERTLESLYAAHVQRGGWTYPSKRRYGDHSNAQYAALGFWAAYRLGLDVPDEQWMNVIEFARRTRMLTGERAVPAFVFETDRLTGKPMQPSFRRFSRTDQPEVGEFLYRIGGNTGTGSMTFGAIPSLVLARAFLKATGSPLFTRRLDREIDEMIVGAWAWLDRHWWFDRVKANFGAPVWQEIHLYGIERAGVLSNVKLVGGKDWYYEGAVYLLSRQHESGWISTQSRYRGYTRKRSFWAYPRQMNTAYALLFLKRATAPVATGK